MVQSRGVAVADENERAGPRLQHVGKVLSAHDRRHRVVDPVLADHVARDLGGERGLPLVIARHRIVALVDELRLGAVELRGALDHLVEALLDQVAHRRIERARGAGQLRGLRDDVVGGAGVKLRDRDHRRLQRIDVARHDRLDLVDDLRADQHRVDRDVRARRVAAEPLDVDVEPVRRGHHRAGPDREVADRQARIIVHAVDLLDLEAVHHAVLHHLAAAAAALLGRLEDHHRGAGEVARLGKIFRGAEQHRGVAVVAAGVHLAGVGGGVGQPGNLGDRQRVHVGAQPDHLVAP